MPCLHRFHKILLPGSQKEFLFIGTFNPEWDIKKGDNPDYFYSRDKSQFWCILPHAFNQACLIDKDKQEKEQFCRDNKVGLTDLIYKLKNVNEKNLDDLSYLTKGFKDESFEAKAADQYKLDIEFFTPRILSYIRSNCDNLKGVFFTRKTSKGIDRIWEQWLFVKQLCVGLNIYTEELSSPSVRGGGIRSKIFSWRKAIENSRERK